jgi:hypothetical protein
VNIRPEIYTTGGVRRSADAHSVKIQNGAHEPVGGLTHPACGDAIYRGVGDGGGVLVPGAGGGVLVPGAGGGVLVPGVGGGVTDPGDGGGVVVDGAVVDGDVLPGGGVTVEGDGGTLGDVPLVLNGRGDVDVLVDVELALVDVPVDVPDAVPAEAGGVLDAAPSEPGVPGGVVEVAGTPGAVRAELELVPELEPVRNVPTVPRTGAAASTPVPPC